MSPSDTVSVTLSQHNVSLLCGVMLLYTHPSVKVQRWESRACTIMCSTAVSAAESNCLLCVCSCVCYSYIITLHGTALIHSLRLLNIASLIASRSLGGIHHHVCTVTPQDTSLRSPPSPWTTCVFLICRPGAGAAE